MSMVKNPEQRITVSDTTYYQQPGMPIQEIPLGFTRFIQTEEQVFQRFIILSDKWVNLDTGWIASPSLIIIKNTASLKDADSFEALTGFAIELSADPANPNVEPFLILPGESMRFCHRKPGTLSIRSRVDKIRAVIVVIPE